MNNILTNRKWTVNGNWYEPRQFINQFSSVVKCDLWDTTSSAGDWAGFFVQKIGKVSYLIMFYQESRGFNSRGYTVATGKAIATWRNYNMTDEEIYQIISDHETIYPDVTIIMP